MTKRTALITGAARGIGKSCAFALSEAGARVVVADRIVDQLQETAAEIRGLGREVLGVEMDLSSLASIKEGFQKASKDFGRIDILVNNAGVTKDALAMRMKKEDWDLVLQINLSGAFFAAQQVLPSMMRERWGRIINVASVVGLAGNPGQPNYVASKAGLIGLTKSLAQEVGSRGITVNAVAPGFIQTAMTEALPNEVRDRLLASIPLKKFGQPQDVAVAVRFLAGEEAGYITGHVLSVNGGMYM